MAKPGLGRRTPGDLQHVEKYSWRSVEPETVISVEKRLRLPSWHVDWYQDGYGACIGFNTTMMMAILNELQARQAGTKPYTHRYNPFWLWNRAKERDEWSDTRPGDNNGTSVRAACDVLRDLGHVLAKANETTSVTSEVGVPDLAEGIQGVNRWATTTDEMRTAIAGDLPISIGVTWYRKWFDPERVNTYEHWIGRGSQASWGPVEGGHCVCIFGASDKRQAFWAKNSWGRDYGYNGRFLIPYETMQTLLDDWGEAVVVLDR